MLANDFDLTLFHCTQSQFSAQGEQRHPSRLETEKPGSHRVDSDGVGGGQKKILDMRPHPVRSRTEATRGGVDHGKMMRMKLE